MATEANSLEQHADEIADLRGQASMLDEYLSTGQIVATTTAAAPTLIITDTWHDTGGLQNGWGKGTGYFKYKLLPDGLVIFYAKGLTCTGATVANGTVICSAANGLAAAYQPAGTHTFPAYSDGLKAAGASFEASALKIMTDGSVQCQGIATSATVLDCWGLIALDI